MMNIDELEGSVVFVIDDNPDNLNLISDGLSSFGLIPIPYKRGETALNAIEKQQPDIILLNITTDDGSDGLETYRRLKTNRFSRDIPVIIMSTTSDMVNNLTSLNVGEVDYVTKPVAIKELLSRLQVHLTISRLQQALQETNQNLEKTISQRTEALQKINESLQREIERDNEAHYRAIVEDTPDLICRFLPDTTLTFVNRAYCQYFDKRSDELIGQQFLSLIPEEAHQAIKDKIAVISGDREPFSYEHQVIAPNGDIRWQSWTDRPIINEAGQVQELQSIGRDITDQKQAEENLKISLAEKEVLLKEIHHRVKNNIQIICSLLDLQADSIQDMTVRNLLQDSQRRIRSMALVHERLYQSQDLARIDFADYVAELTHHLQNSFGSQSRSITLDLSLPPVFFTVENAIPCGLIINELVANAFKHAFSPNQPGQILIEIQFIEPDHLSLLVRDNGLGLPPTFDVQQSRSLGMTLVNTLVRQIRGTIAWRNHNGLEVTISFRDPTAQVGA